MATYVFFVVTGYKFRPANQSPYFNVRDLDDDDEVEILTQTGYNENIQKVTNRSITSTTTVESFNEDEKEKLIGKRESSHEYD
jgi:G protein-coupled receptor 107